jgi:UDP-N-acetylmuramoyl-tripeptide--D-alanyl-D-alanine ligase
VRGEPTALTAARMAAAMQGRVVTGDPAVEPTGFSIDSRSIEPGQAFFAIVAARDGHEFAGDAVARGARVVVVSRELDLPALAPAAVVQVTETTRALQDLGSAVRQQSAAKVVAITGSAGKTTTKETIAALLEGTFTVVKNPGNLNNHLGLPLSLLELRHGADVAVMELGMNHAGEIRVLVGLAEPDVRVWTNVGDAHIGNFGSPDAIAAAKAEILDGAGRDAVFVANADDPRVMRYAAGFPGRVVTFGYAEGADVRAVDVVELGLGGMQATLKTHAAEHRLTVLLLGRGNLANVLCAVAVASELGVPLADLVTRVARLAPARRRGEVRVLGRGVTVVDDSYNSSPAALRRSLETLARERITGRRVAVLGEMLELGDLSMALHEECGRAAAAAGLNLLVTVGGPPAEALGRTAVGAGMSTAAVRHAATSAEAADLAARLVAPGDVVLVKGSRGVKTDLVVDRLAAVFA